MAINKELGAFCNRIVGASRACYKLAILEDLEDGIAKLGTMVSSVILNL